VPLAKSDVDLGPNAACQYRCMSSVLDQVLPIAGVIIGAAMTWAAGTFTDRSQWRRSQSIRWDERRLQAYTDYATAVKQDVRLCLRIASFRGLGTLTHPLDPATGVPILAEIEDRRSALFEAVVLLGNPATVAAARGWQQSVWDLHSMVDGTETVTQDVFLGAFRAAGIARDEFHRTARLDLEVTSGFVPTEDFRQLSPDQRRV
jgi:hypothetical protein